MTDFFSVSRGRPLVEIDWALIDRILARGGKMPDCVYLTGVSASTIERRIREEMGMTFNDYRQLQLTSLRLKILDKQVEVAMEGDSAMLKHLGEQYCDQSTKNQNLNVTASVEDFLKALDQGGEDGNN